MPINRKYKCKSPQGGEAGFTLIEMIIVIVLLSILSVFIFQILTKSLSAQINMQNRKERADDAVMILEKVSRELREAKTISSAGSNTLIFEKNVTSSTDTNTVVKFILNTSTNELMRQSATSVGGLPGNSTSGSVIAKYVSSFSVSEDATNRVYLELVFNEAGKVGSEWQTKVFIRNYGL